MTITLTGIGDLSERFYYIDPNQAMIVDGKGGDDYIGGSPIGSQLIGGAGNDIVYGLDDNDIIFGDVIGEQKGGNDVLDGRDGDDRISAGGGNDHATGGAGNDIVKGQNGKDVLWGGGGADRISGGKGDDQLFGDSGPQSIEFHTTIDWDAIEGAPASFSDFTYVFGPTTDDGSPDVLKGGAGKDLLAGGGGNDILKGGADADIFLFNTELHPTDNVDRLKDFTPGEDSIHLDDTIFAALGGVGVPSADAFHKGDAAADSEDRIIYNKETGAAYYDSDGSGSAANAVQFAQLAPHLSLHAHDFLVV